MPSRTWSGIILIGLGVLFLLASPVVMSFWNLIRDFWPLLLIGWGIWLVMRHSSRPASHRGEGVSEGLETHTSGRLESTNVFGDLVLAVESTDFSGGTVSNVFGDIRIDLSRAVLVEGESVLRVDGVFASTTIIPPHNTEYSLAASTVMGDIERENERRGGFSISVDYASPAYVNALRKLRIVVSQVFGDIVVRN